MSVSLNSQNYANQYSKQPSFGARIPKASMQEFFTGLTDSFPEYYNRGFLANLKNSAPDIRNIKIDGKDPIITIDRVKNEGFLGSVKNLLFKNKKEVPQEITYKINAHYPDGKGIGVESLTLNKNGILNENSFKVIEKFVNAIKRSTANIVKDPEYLKGQSQVISEKIGK